MHKQIKFDRKVQYEPLYRGNEFAFTHCTFGKIESL